MSVHYKDKAHEKKGVPVPRCETTPGCAGLSIRAHVLLMNMSRFKKNQEVTAKNIMKPSVAEHIDGPILHFSGEPCPWKIRDKNAQLVIASGSSATKILQSLPRGDDCRLRLRRAPFER